MRDAIRRTEQLECLVVIMEERRREMAGKMSKEKWIGAGTKLAEPLKEFERLAEQMGLSLVHVTAHGCKNGLRASAVYQEDGVWYEVNMVDNTIRLVVDGDQFYTQT